MVTYLSLFIPGPSMLTDNIHELLKKDTKFTWNATFEAVFQRVKDVIVKDKTLCFWDTSLPVTDYIEVSKAGLGTTLLLNNKPLASIGPDIHRLPLCQHHMQDVSCGVYRGEHFLIHVYGCSFTTESDHKPLEAITQRTLLTHHPSSSMFFMDMIRS